MIRTRIAPSPTGSPHIGTIYQALFDYAYATKHQGKFIVRIEDTDQSRLVPEAEQQLYDALDWFGLPEDESPRKGGAYGPYKQSERLDLYTSHAHQLLAAGHAYYCFCSKERLEQVRKKMQSEGKIPMYDKHCRQLKPDEVTKRKAAGEAAVIRMKVPESTSIKTHDLIRGEVVFQSAVVDDQVIVKSDGFPTYHLAVVVDDHHMEITHVVRGEEWIPSSPKHVLLYQFFGWEPPVFFHTPVLRNPDKSKFSKRHSHTGVTWYREQGYLPEAILNYLALMGWSHPDQKDIFPLEEFFRLFDLKDVKPVGPIFDVKKLAWMSGQYIMKLDRSALTRRIHDFYQGKYLAGLVEKTVPLIQERIKTFSEYQPLCDFFFTKPGVYELELQPHQPMLQRVYADLKTVSDWNAGLIGDQMARTATALGMKNSQFFMILRVAITGRRISPPLNESMEILGKDECLQRIFSVLS